MKRFSRIYIEITNVCNLSCSFCIGNARLPRYMSTDEFAYIIQQAKTFTNSIYLHVLGEPLLHPQLEKILDTADKEQLRVSLTTNGTLLADKQNFLLQSHALRKISISLHSLQPNSTHNAQEYLRNVALFVTAASKCGKLCDLRLWNLGVSDNNNATIFNLLCELLELDSTKQLEARAKLCESGNITLAPNIFLGTAVKFDWPSMNAPRTKQSVFCHALRNQVAILCDGTVVPCCLDSMGDIALGNIYKTELALILASERAQKLYDGFSARSPSEELCRRCGYATRF